tara:strand:+ start:2202 stop:2972 length:771 start_codon:yes stop_codon:yes gene_type:complete
MKKVLVTGAFGFLGSKISSMLLKKNFYVICVDKYIDEKNINFIKLRSKYKKKFIPFSCDFESENQIKQLLKFTKKKFKSLDILINNASLTGDTLNKGWNVKFSSQSNSNFEKAIKVNLVSIFQICKGLKNIINKSKQSNIINITSIYSSLGFDKNMYKGTGIFNPAGYGSSKAGVAQLTRWLASEFAPNTRVNCIAVGGIIRKQNKRFIKNYSKKTPLGRMATEDDIVNLIQFLSSKGSSYITGQEIFIDGGFSII